MSGIYISIFCKMSKVAAFLHIGCKAKIASKGRVLKVLFIFSNKGLLQI
jgi:hypothetical protein